MNISWNGKCHITVVVQVSLVSILFWQANLIKYLFLIKKLKIFNKLFLFLVVVFLFLCLSSWWWRTTQRSKNMHILISTNLMILYHYKSYTPMTTSPISTWHSIVAIVDCQHNDMPYHVAILDCTHADHTVCTVLIDTTSKTVYSTDFFRLFDCSIVLFFLLAFFLEKQDPLYSYRLLTSLLVDNCSCWKLTVINKTIN